MITDEQVKAAVSTYHDAYHHHPQIMADMRKALEAYEANKWVRFDADNESTYPPFDTRVLVKLKGDFDVRIDFMTHNKEWYNAIRLRYVTHWQHLPTFKE
jgi:hypothetical protein